MTWNHSPENYRGRTWHHGPFFHQEISILQKTTCFPHLVICLTPPQVSTFNPSFWRRSKETDSNEDLVPIGMRFPGGQRNHQPSGAKRRLRDLKKWRYLGGLHAKNHKAMKINQFKAASLLTNIVDLPLPEISLLVVT